MLSCEFCEILRTPFYIEHLWWLLLRKLKDHFVVALKIDCHISSDLRDDPVLNAIENFSGHILKKKAVKKDSQTDKKNYSPISILPNISKMKGVPTSN